MNCVVCRKWTFMALRRGKTEIPYCYRHFPLEEARDKIWHHAGS